MQNHSFHHHPSPRRLVHAACVTFVLACAAGISAFADDKPESVSQKIDEQARLVLNGVQKTSYTHKVSIDVEKGEYHTDASGLLNFLLQKVSTSHLQTVKTQGKQTRQFAQDYWGTFHAAPTSQPAAKAKEDAGAWQQIAKVSELRPGDLVAIKSTSESAESATDAGTVMIVDEKAVEEPKPKDTTKNESVRGPKGRMENKQVKVPPADSHRLYRLVVIDSSKSPHASDSRAAGSTGVGRGTLWLDVDNSGRPVAIHWTAVTGKPSPAVIALGRAVGKTQSRSSGSNASSGSNGSN
jgi:hypothetical protein